jgi:hypothetical protein
MPMNGLLGINATIHGQSAAQSQQNPIAAVSGVFYTSNRLVKVRRSESILSRSYNQFSC